MASSPTTIPTSLGDIFPAPDVHDALGNRLYSNWSVSFPQYRFNVSSLEAVRFSYFHAHAAWPNLYKFTGSVVSGADTSNAAQSLLRKIIFDVASGQMINNLSQTLLAYKPLLACVIIGLLVSFIILPIAACLTYCFVRKRYRDNFRYSPYSSDSLATAAYDQQRHSSYVTRTASDQSATSRWPSSSYSHGLVAMAVIAILSAIIALFGIGGSFYFNNSFSFSLNRTGIIVDDAMADVNSIIDDFTGQFGTVGDTLTSDMKVKMDFAMQAMNSLGNVFTDQGRVFDLLAKSRALYTFLLLLSWEMSAIRPLIASLEDTKNVTKTLMELEYNMTAFNKNYSTVSNIRNLCLNDNPALSSCSLSRTGNNSNNRICSTCLLPSRPDSIDPFTLPQSVRLQNNIDVLLERAKLLLRSKLGQMVTRDDLMNQFTGIKTEAMADFNNWTSHYTDWYNHVVQSAIKGGDCSGYGRNLYDADSDYYNEDYYDADIIITRRTKSPNQTWETTTRGSSASPRATKERTGSSTTESGPTMMGGNFSGSGGGGSFEIQPALGLIHDAFNDRHIAVLVLLIAGTVQLALMIAGSLCLLVVYCKGADQSHNFRARRPSTLEKVGRTSIMVSAVFFVSVTSPLLCLIAAIHFYAGGFIDRTVCQVIRARDYKAIDRMLNTDEHGNERNILRYILPPCMQVLVDSLDQDLLDNRLTIGKFLQAAEKGQTLNQFLQLNNTLFVQDVRNLTFLKLTTKFVVYNDKISDYMNNVSDIGAAQGFFQDFVDAINLTDAITFNATLRTCSSCVINSFRNNSNNRTNLLLNEASTYQSYLSQYLAQLPDAYSLWADTVSTLAGIKEQRRQLIELMVFAEKFFLVILSLLKSQMSYIVGKIIDNLAEGLTSDIGRLRAAWELYDGLAREYLCVELIGSLNAFWFFVGIYLLFSAISAILLIATYAALTAMRRTGGLQSDYWQNRSNNNNDHGLGKYSMPHMEPVSSRTQLTLSYRNSNGNDNKAFMNDSFAVANDGENNNRTTGESYIMSSVHVPPQSSPSASHLTSSDEVPVMHNHSSESSDVEISLKANNDISGSNNALMTTTTFTNSPREQNNK